MELAHSSPEPPSPREAIGAGREEETRDSMGERGRGGNIAEIHLGSPTLCDGHVAKKKNGLVYRRSQRGGPADGLYVGCRRGRGHPGAVSTSRDPCVKSVPSPDPDIWEGNPSTI